MYHQRFTFRLIVRIIFINLNLLLLLYLLKNTTLWFTISGVGIVLLIQLFSLYQFITQINNDIDRFILAIKHRDHTLNFQQKSTKGSFPQLYESFTDILNVHKNIQLEQDAVFHLFKTILEQVTLGVIAIKTTTDEDMKDTEEVMFFNEAATNLLDIPQYKYWHRVRQHLPLFATEIEQLKGGGKKFFELIVNERTIQLSTSVIPMKLYGADYLIISFQNIKDEVEQKELEAWNKLIEVISHEILNSITPISSLSQTVSQLISNKTSLSSDDLEDIRPAISTIKKRSEGLMDFVKDYRLVAELPSPDLSSHLVSELLAHIQTLMQPMAKERSVQLKVEKSVSKTSLQMDFKLIEQALINLVTNSIYAVENSKEPCVTISSRFDNGLFYIDVTDNGKGIDKDDIERIFVPFFTTRQNGSGIGLTITRNIMKIHRGNIEVNSIVGEMTRFSLVFNY